MHLKLYSSLLLCGLSAGLSAQQAQMDPSEIYASLQKMSQTTRVLYIAAHPDDENTRLLTFLSRGKHFETAYLSLTRGDGGQNLIGDEQGADLGVVRTQELLAARRVDGTRQFFTRAIDFGYSKSAQESLSLWQHDSILSDVVWVIRQFQPDIIITRFPPDERAGHGHHTASAMLALEAFDLAADPGAFPEQLKWCEPWKVERVFWNASSWWDKTLPDQVDNKTVFGVDVGGYDPILGMSYGELAGKARSQHRSQGFGVSPYRGEQIEYLRLLKGELQPGSTDPFEADSHWAKMVNGTETRSLLVKMLEEYDMKDPLAALPDLLKMYALVPSEDRTPQWTDKQNRLSDIIAASVGLWLEPVVIAKETDRIQISAECLSAAGVSATVTGMDLYFPGDGNDLFPMLHPRGKAAQISSEKQQLPANIFVRDTFWIAVTPGANATPYWLQRPYGTTYQAADAKWRGQPEWDDLPAVRFRIQLGESELAFTRKLVEKKIDPARGEYYVPVQMLPAYHVHVEEQLCLFKPGLPSEVHVKLDGLDAETTGDLKLRIPSGWSVSPASIRIQGNEHTLYTFQVTASDNGSEGVITPVFHSHGNDYEQEITDIIYEHLPEQHIAHIASRPAMVLLMHVPEGSYAYIEGAGDLVLESLQAAGVNVEPLSVNDLAVTDLSIYDAIITGVRAYNVSDRLISAQPLLLQYVQQGGTLLVQYNTTNNFTLGRNADGASMGPYPFSLTRGRTTDENASPEFLLPDHPVWNTPDKITADDFEGWVQERGLYYADATADHYQAPLGFADPGEETLRGAILTTDYGQGTFIYTGLSFFRQLPAGVPGAYKLFFNMMTY